MPKICEAPLRYDRCMFSLLGEGDLRESATAPGGKNDVAALAGGGRGDSAGVFLKWCEDGSGRIHGPLFRFSETAESTGEDAFGETLGLSSLPSA